MSASYTASAWSIFWKGARPKEQGKCIRLFFNNPAKKLILFDQNCQGWQWFHTVAMFCAGTKLAFNCCTWTYNSWRWFKWSHSLNFSAIFIYFAWCVSPFAGKMCEILSKISHRRKATAKNIFNAVALFRNFSLRSDLSILFFLSMLCRIDREPPLPSPEFWAES